MQLECIFVTSGRHPETERLICKATNSIYSHAAARIMIEGQPRIIEAVRPAVRIAPGDAFDGCEVLQIIPLPLSDEQHDAVIAKAFELVGKAYGVDDCLIGGTMDVFGADAAAWVERLFGDEDTENCSATLVQLIRAAYPDFATGIKSSVMTPESTRQKVLELAGELE